MQQRVDSKSRLTHYYSVKDYDSNKELGKKKTKPSHNKSSQKGKNTKNNTPSANKPRPPSRSHKNNQNFNSVNIVPQSVKPKHQSHLVQPLKKEIRKEDKSNRNSTEKLVKCRSAIRLQSKTSRLTPSPIASRDHLDDKPKTYRNVASKTEREKKSVHKTKPEKPMMRKSGSVATIHIKREVPERINNNNRASIKTEISSKMNSVIREEEKPKKPRKKEKGVVLKKEVTGGKTLEKRLGLMKKEKKSKLETKIQRSILYSEVSFQEFIQENPYESELLCNEKIFLEHPALKVKTEGCQASIELPQKSLAIRTAAALRIQKVFRGFITRKYIDEARFIIGKVITIQTWWRKVLSKRQKKKVKPLSIESSLITIKDFNETMKADKARLLSGSKENTLSNHKLNMKELIRNILEESEESEQSSPRQKQRQGTQLEPEGDDCQSPDRKMLTKQVYVEGKIKGEINSEKIFNSPKCMNSPGMAKTPTHLTFAIKDFFSTNSNEKQKVKEILNSPRIKSPQAPKATPVSNSRQQAQEFQIYPSQSPQVEPFETNFAAIEEFCLLMVNFLRDRPAELKELLRKITNFKWYRTQLILGNWNSYKLVPQSFLSCDDTLPLDYEFLQLFDRPRLFSPQLREEVLRFPEIQIELSNRRFDIDGDRNREVHRGFLQFVFDVLEEAFYHPFKYFVLEWRGPRSLLQFKDNANLFENIFSSALGQLFNWGEVLCGLMLEGPMEEDPQLAEMRELQRQGREKVMDKRLEHWDLGLGSRLGIKVQVSEEIVEQLVEQLSRQMMFSCL